MLLKCLVLQAKHTDYDGAFLSAAATEQCHTQRKWEVDSAQLCQTFEKKRGKRTCGKTQVVTVAVVSCFKEEYRRVFLRNLDMVKLHEVSNLIKISPSKMHYLLGTVTN